MNNAGPPLERLLHRLSECPREFWHSASGAAISIEQLTAITCDYFRQFEPELIAAPIVQVISKHAAERCGIVGIVIWLIADDWFVSRRELSMPLLQMLNHPHIKDLAELVNAERLINDPDRREELVRLTLSLLDMRPAGESLAQAKDRLNTLDTGERQRVLKATQAAERRAREIREAMQRAKAQESASRYGE